MKVEISSAEIVSDPVVRRLIHLLTQRSQKQLAVLCGTSQAEASRVLSYNGTTSAHRAIQAQLEKDALSLLEVQLRG